MLRMAPFEVVHASSADEAVALTHELSDEQEVRYIAGCLLYTSDAADE